VGSREAAGGLGAFDEGGSASLGHVKWVQPVFSIYQCDASGRVSSLPWYGRLHVGLSNWVIYRVQCPAGICALLSLSRPMICPIKVISVAGCCHGSANLLYKSGLLQ
jgi:hypothetical protein